MPMDQKGKYHMSPHHAKMADSAPPKGGSADTSDPAPDAMDMGTDPDAGQQMITCPSCGSQFPEEMGLAQPEAMPQPQQPQSSGAPPAGLSGY